MTSIDRTIELRGVRVHNLHGIDLDLPLHKLIVISGVSGAGKTSLAFGTLYAEGQRRYVESFSTYSRQFLEQLERPDADRIEHIPPAVAIRSPRSRHSRRTTVAVLGDLQAPLQLLFTRLGKIVCPDCRCKVAAHTPTSVRTFIESLPQDSRVQICFSTAIPAVKPKGTEKQVRQQLLQTLRAKGFNRLIVAGATRVVDESVETADPPVLPPEASEALVVIDRIKAGQVTAERLADSLELAFSEGDGGCVILVEAPSGLAPDDSASASRSFTVDGRNWTVHRFWVRPVCSGCRREFVTPEPRLFNFNTSLGACPKCRGRGVVSETAADRSSPSRRSVACPDCNGRRYHPFALAVQVAGLDFAEWCGKPVREVIPILDQLAQTVPVESRGATASIIPALATRLRHLDSLALDYLCLDRPVNTLSAGEIKRTSLAAALSSNLVNMLVVMDEPTAGLHPSERERVLAALRRLRDAPNSLVVVEHDAELIQQSDWLVDIGPGAGGDGGRIVYAGPPEGIRNSPASATASWLFPHAPDHSAESQPRRKPTGWLRLEGVRHLNLHGITVEFPLGVLCVITGVGGSGKRSLVLETLVPALMPAAVDPPERSAEVSSTRRVERVVVTEQIKQFVVVDQRPISRTARSIVATSLGVFAQIRTLFAEMNEAKVRNFGASHFSFNAATGGGCPACEGTGAIAVDMQFLPDVSMTCPDCRGTRYRREILEVKYRGLNLAELLAQTVREAFAFFRGQSRLQRRLKNLKDVGLDYLTLGRPVITLSNGESQRLKLAASLAGGTRPGTLFVVEEPAGGLHRADVERLLACFDSLLDGGNSLIAIENRLDVLAAADWLIELGPGSGEQGGQVITAGTPEQLMKDCRSATGRCLAEFARTLLQNT